MTPEALIEAWLAAERLRRKAARYGLAPNEGIDRATYDRLMVNRDRPLTQDPIGTWPHTKKGTEG